MARRVFIWANFSDKDEAKVGQTKRMSENFFVLHKTLVDPPKSPLKRGTLINFPPPLIKGGKGGSG
ncbi:hypothetical protein A2T98_02410 [Nodularia spumigena CENA596]|uniref:Uncharacterized protein n=1 Tax=Nodularia spumigena CENA596 TaxID=1819295 RepID=A0A166KPU6_NODSP|nr:hypothetical protein A2T98_02410 [Nodularia spumigena CENA596]